MTSSRSRRLAAAAVLGAVFWTGAVSAQSQGPRILRPQAETPKPDGPRQIGEIRVDRLNAPGRSAAGVLTEGDGGLPASLWLGSDRQTIALLLARLPDRFRSEAARDLARRVLLTAGDMAPGPVSDYELLAARMTALVRMGEAESAAALADAAGGAGESPEVARPLADAFFALGETGRACDTVQGQIGLGGRGYWQQASVLCDLISGQTGSAELMRSVLSETGQAGDAFNQLADAVQFGREATLTATPETTLLHAAMLSAAGGSVRKAGSLPPHVARALSTAPRVAASSRIESGVAAARYSGLSPSVAMFLFDGKAGPEGGDLRDPVVGAMGAASTVARAEALNTLWSRAAAAGDHQLAAGFAEGFLKQMEPQAGINFVAPAALRMSLLLGQDRKARGWLTALNRASAGGEADLRDAAEAAGPLAQIAGLQDVDEAVLRPWALRAVTDPEGRERVLLALTLLDALGTPAGPGVWREVLSVAGGKASVAADPALWRQLVMAAGNGRLGEGVLSALDLIGADGPRGMDTVSVATVVGALRRMNMVPSARRLAVEAYIASGG